MPQAHSLAQAVTTTGVVGRALAAPGGAPYQRFALQCKGVGAAPTSFSATLEGSLDGQNWTAILGSPLTTDGATVWDGGGKPSLYVRANVTALTLGSATALAVTVVAAPGN